MSRINMKNWISQVIQSKERMAIPIMTYPGIELTGKSVYEAVTNGKVHFEAIKAISIGSNYCYNGPDRRSRSFRSVDYVSGE